MNDRGFAYQESEQLPKRPEKWEFHVSEVYGNLGLNNPGNVKLDLPWWHRHVQDAHRNESASLDVSLDSILFLALKASKQIQIASAEPIIQETRIDEADSRFDWVRYLNSAWDDTSDPIGNSLQAGGNVSRLNEHNLSGAIGTRRLTRTGGNFDVGQQVGFRNSNSTFITPNNQATSRFTISYTHPLRRGRGYEYNNSLVLLATTDAEIAFDQFTAQLQNHLLEIINAYWRLYLDRAILAQRVRLYLKTENLVSILNTRQKIDANGTQLISASAALENRKADLVRAATSVQNSETILRGLISASDLGESNLVELIPVDSPDALLFESNLATEIETALIMRPEARVALRQVKSGSILLDVAKHEILPSLNLVTQAYLSGLRGDYDFIGSLGDQISEGAPGYSIGIQYELPYGNRLAHAQLTRRQVELRRLKLQYQFALETIRTEVEVAVRECNTSYYEALAKQRVLKAAIAEAETIAVRWSQFIDGTSQSSLNLESLLRAQERVTEAESELANAIFVYNVALVSLKKANGTFLKSEQITIERVADADGPKYVLDKGIQKAVYLEDLDRREPEADPVELLENLEPILIPSNSDMHSINPQDADDGPSFYSQNALTPYVLQSPLFKQRQDKTRSQPPNEDTMTNPSYHPPKFDSGIQTDWSDLSPQKDEGEFFEEAETSTEPIPYEEPGELIVPDAFPPSNSQSGEPQIQPQLKGPADPTQSTDSQSAYDYYRSAEDNQPVLRSIAGDQNSQPVRSRLNAQLKSGRRSFNRTYNNRPQTEPKQIRQTPRVTIARQRNFEMLNESSFATPNLLINDSSTSWQPTVVPEVASLLGSSGSQNDTSGRSKQVIQNQSDPSFGSSRLGDQDSIRRRERSTSPNQSPRNIRDFDLVPELNAPKSIRLERR
ncbi:MAG: TolC family protein [Planctomycetota bacterium]